MAAKVKRGDTVQVMAGKDRGRRGEVRRMLPARGRAVVGGLNLVKKHRRARMQGETSEIVEMEAPLHVSNLQVVCSSCDRATRVGFRILDDGRKVRHCKRCNEAID